MPWWTIHGVKSHGAIVDPHGDLGSSIDYVQLYGLKPHQTTAGIRTHHENIKTRQDKAPDRALMKLIQLLYPLDWLKRKRPSQVESHHYVSHRELHEAWV